MLDTGDLSAFVEAAKDGTFSAAAASLYTTQPSLSRRIARLERVLGGSLFDRSNRRSPRLAPLGELLLPYAQQMLAEQARFEDLARAYSQGRTGVVTVVVSEATAELALPTLYAYVNQRFGDLHLKIVERPVSELSHALLAREAEVGFGRVGPELDSIAFGLTTHIAMGHPRFLGETDDPIEWDELRLMPLLLGVRLDQILRPNTRSPRRVVHEGGCPRLLRTMARAEMGVIILGGVRESEGLVCRPIVDNGCIRQTEVNLAWAREGVLTAPARRLVDDLRTHLDHMDLPILEEGCVVQLV